MSVFEAPALQGPHVRILHPRASLRSFLLQKAQRPIVLWTLTKPTDLYFFSPLALRRIWPIIASVLVEASILRLSDTGLLKPTENGANP